MRDALGFHWHVNLENYKSVCFKHVKPSLTIINIIICTQLCLIRSVKVFFFVNLNIIYTILSQFKSFFLLAKSLLCGML